jgi:hypothetical protein
MAEALKKSLEKELKNFKSLLPDLPASITVYGKSKDKENAFVILAPNTTVTCYSLSKEKLPTLIEGKEALPNIGGNVLQTAKLGQSLAVGDKSKAYKHAHIKQVGKNEVVAVETVYHTKNNATDKGVMLIESTFPQHPGQTNSRQVEGTRITLSTLPKDEDNQIAEYIQMGINILAPHKEISKDNPIVMNCTDPEAARHLYSVLLWIGNLNLPGFSFNEDAIDTRYCVGFNPKNERSNWVMTKLRFFHNYFLFSSDSVFEKKISKYLEDHPQIEQNISEMAKTKQMTLAGSDNPVQVTGIANRAKSIYQSLSMKQQLKDNIGLDDAINAEKGEHVNSKGIK